MIKKTQSIEVKNSTLLAFSHPDWSLPYIYIYLVLDKLKRSTKTTLGSSQFLCSKNPAYGKQIISQPMRIVAPIPQKPEFFEKQKKSCKTLNLINGKKYAKISATLFDQRSLIHLEAWFPGGPKIPKNPFLFLQKRKNSSKT